MHPALMVQDPLAQRGESRSGAVLESCAKLLSFQGEGAPILQGHRDGLHGEHGRVGQTPGEPSSQQRGEASGNMTPLSDGLFLVEHHRNEDTWHYWGGRVKQTTTWTTHTRRVTTGTCENGCQPLLPPSSISKVAKKKKGTEMSLSLS